MVTSGQLRAFLTLAEERRFTRAAQRLGLSQSAFTRQLQALENQLGARLVVRAQTGAVLTEAGDRFLVHARRAVDALESGRAAVEQLGHEERGAVSLGTLMTVGAYLLPRALRIARQALPDVRVRLYESSSEDLQARVAGGQMDLAILTLPIRRTELVAQRLWQEVFVLAVPKGHRLTGLKRPVRLKEVAQEPFVVIRGAATTRALQAACEERGVAPNIQVETDNSESMRRLVEQGLGLALLPEIMSRDNPSFDVVQVSQGGLKRHVALVHRGQDYLQASARGLQRILLQELRAQPAP